MKDYIKNIVEGFDFSQVKTDNAIASMFTQKYFDIIFDKLVHKRKMTYKDYLSFCDNIKEGYPYKYKVKNRNDLNNIVDDIANHEHPYNISDYNWLDVSNITDMSMLFRDIKTLPDKFDISKWNTSNVTDMSEMFLGTNFNGDISDWDVSEVSSFADMFETSPFNGDLRKWDVSGCRNFMLMFCASGFCNDSVCNWDVSHALKMSGMFADTKFNGDLSKWEPKWCMNFENMFAGTKKFNNDSIKNWNIKQAASVNGIFFDAKKMSKSNIETVAAYWGISDLSVLTECR